MKIRMILFRTNATGEILQTRHISDEVIRRLSCEEDAGDERYIRSGELIVEAYQTIPYIAAISTLKQWIAVYLNDILYNVYQHPGEDEWFETNETPQGQVYSYRLFPIQRVFYEDLKRTVIEYSATSTHWSYDLDGALASIAEIAQEDDPVPTTDKWVFQLGYMLEGMEGRTNDYGYEVSEINSLLVTDADETPVIWRGYSLPDTALEEDIIAWTFVQQDVPLIEFNYTWMDLFKLIAARYGAFIQVEHSLEAGDIEGQTLGVIVKFTPKNVESIFSPVQIAINDLKILSKKSTNGDYQANGIKISGPNWEEALGNTTTGHQINIQVDFVNDYFSQPITDFETALMAAVADLDGSNEFTGSLFENFGVTHYGNWRDSGDGFQIRCSLFYEDAGERKALKVLDQIQEGDNLLQIMSLSFDKEGIANIKGTVIYPT